MSRPRRFASSRQRPALPLLCLLLAGLACSRAPAAQNVLLVVIDTLRAGPRVELRLSARYHTAHRRIRRPGAFVSRTHTRPRAGPCPRTLRFSRAYSRSSTGPPRNTRSSMKLRRPWQSVSQKTATRPSESLATVSSIGAAGSPADSSVLSRRGTVLQSDARFPRKGIRTWWRCAIPCSRSARRAFLRVREFCRGPRSLPTTCAAPRAIPVTWESPPSDRLCSEAQGCRILFGSGINLRCGICGAG